MLIGPGSAKALTGPVRKSLVPITVRGRKSGRGQRPAHQGFADRTGPFGVGQLGLRAGPIGGLRKGTAEPIAMFPGAKVLIGYTAFPFASRAVMRQGTRLRRCNR